MVDMDMNEKIFLWCPYCKNHTSIHVLRQTMLLNFPLTCAICGKRSIISLVDGKILVEELEEN